MDIETIAPLAVSILSPYLDILGTAAAEKLGEIVPEKIGDLYNAITKKFSGDEGAESVLELAKKDPTSKGLSLALAEIIEKKMMDDGDFSELMTSLVSDIQPSSQGDNIEQNIKVSGKSGDIYQIGSIKGDDINIGRRGD